MAVVWLAFVALATLQRCEAAEIDAHGVLEAQPAGQHGTQAPQDDACCHSQASNPDLFPGLSLSDGSFSLFKLVLSSFLPTSFLLPASAGRPVASPALGEPPPAQSSPFLATIRLLI